MLAGKTSRYKFFWASSEEGNGDEGIPLAIQHGSHLWPNHSSETGIWQGHSGISKAETKYFYDQLCIVVAKIPTQEIVILLGSLSAWYEEVP